MAKLSFRYSNTGSNLYVVVTDINNLHLRFADHIFETYVAANWDSYDFPTTEMDSYLYELMLPSLDDGVYSAEVFLRDGASPALTDNVIGQKSFELSDNEFNNSKIDLILIQASIDEIKLQMAQLTRAMVRFNV